MSNSATTSPPMWLPWWIPFLSPPLRPFAPHPMLDRPPNLFDDLTIPPPLPLPHGRIHLAHSPLIPTIDLEFPHITAPPKDFRWNRHVPLPQIYTEDMAEKFLRLAPLVPAELPCLACGEDCYDARPVVGFELVGAVNKNEAEGSA